MNLPPSAHYPRQYLPYRQKNTPISPHVKEFHDCHIERRRDTKYRPKIRSLRFSSQNAVDRRVGQSAYIRKLIYRKLSGLSQLVDTVCDQIRQRNTNSLLPLNIGRFILTTEIPVFSDKTPIFENFSVISLIGISCR